MKLPYRISVLLLFSVGLLFAISPWLTVHSISNAVHSNDQKAWPKLVNESNFKTITVKILTAMLNLKMRAEINDNPSKAREAMKDYLKSKEQMFLLVNKLLGPKGFSHFLCGDLSGDLNQKMHIDSDCWAVKGKLTWESPTQVRVTFNNPETDWQTSLILQRQGLFNWQGVAVDLPVEAILDKFAESVGLKKV